MQTILRMPPIAFLIYLGLAGSIALFGRWLAGASSKDSVMKHSTYAGGEAPPTTSAAPGYRPFFIVALFFAILHLGVLVVATGALNGTTIVYLGGLILALITLILG